MDNKSIRILIWIYFLLLIFEGSLRKWVVPGLANPLLIIRDPVVVLIYAVALYSGALRINKFLGATMALAMASLAFSFLAGQDNFVVTLYGFRTNYLHLPLIWVMGNTLTRRDVELIGCVVLIIGIANSILMAAQFNSPMNAWINRGVGESEEGGQLEGAMGRIRPPGFFSFISGPQLFVPLTAAFFFYQITKRRLWWPVFIASGLAIFLALPISISRTVAIATGIVGATYVFCQVRSGLISMATIRTGIIAVILLFGLSFLPVFEKGKEVFMARWDHAALATGGTENIVEGLFNRLIGGFTQPFEWMAQADIFGVGMGVGSNVGARLLTGSRQFLLPEDEWGKIFMELGPLLGLGFIALRVALTAHLGWLCWRALVSERYSLPLLLFSAIGIAILQNQWAPPTILGFAVFGGGLILASLNPDEEAEYEEDSDEEEDEENSEENEPEDGEEDDTERA